MKVNCSTISWPGGTILFTALDAAAKRRKLDPAQVRAFAPGWVGLWAAGGAAPPEKPEKAIIQAYEAATNTKAKRKTENKAAADGFPPELKEWWGRYMRAMLKLGGNAAANANGAKRAEILAAWNKLTEAQQEAAPRFIQPHKDAAGQYMHGPVRFLSDTLLNLLEAEEMQGLVVPAISTLTSQTMPLAKLAAICATLSATGRMRRIGSFASKR